MEIKSRLESVTDKGKWTARGASIVAKAKATKVVWFPPQPVESGKSGAAKAKKATNSTAKKSSRGAAKKAGGASKKAGSAAQRTSRTKKKAGASGRK